MSNSQARFFKKGNIYPIDLLLSCKAHAGKCRFCSCPVLYAPIVEIMINHFKVIAYKLIDSTEGQHHCLKYKLDNEGLYRNY